MLGAYKPPLGFGKKKPCSLKRSPKRCKIFAKTGAWLGTCKVPTLGCKGLAQKKCNPTKLRN